MGRSAKQLPLKQDGGRDTHTMGNVNAALAERLSAVRQLLADYVREQEPRQLHRLRVELKKVRALAAFAKQLHGDALSMPGLKALFRLAGAIRERQIAIQVLRSLPRVPHRFIARLRTEEQQLLHRLIQQQELHQRRLKKLAKQFHRNTVGYKLRHVRRYFEVEQEEAGRHRNTGTPQGLHAYRAAMKRLLYVYHQLPDRMRGKFRWQAESIDQLQEQLGRWHDTYATLGFFSRQPLSKSEAAALTALRRREQRQFRALKSIGKLTVTLAKSKT